MNKVLEKQDGNEVWADPVILSEIKVPSVEMVDDSSIRFPFNTFYETERFLDVGYPVNGIDSKGNPIYTHHILCDSDRIIHSISVEVDDELEVPLFGYSNSHSEYIPCDSWGWLTIIGIWSDKVNGWYYFDNSYFDKNIKLSS